MEIWRDIPDYEGIYQVSTQGLVKSLERKIWMKRNNCFKTLKERILKEVINPSGYRQVVLHKTKAVNTFKVSVLVAMAFLGHKKCKFKIVVDHKDEIKTNDSLYNLQLITHRENISKNKLTLATKSSIYTGVDFFKSSNKWRAMIEINHKKKHLGLFDSEIEASNAYQEKLSSIT